MREWLFLFFNLFFIFIFIYLFKVLNSEKNKSNDHFIKLKNKMVAGHAIFHNHWLITHRGFNKNTNSSGLKVDYDVVGLAWTVRTTFTFLSNIFPNRYRKSQWAQKRPEDVLVPVSMYYEIYNLTSIGRL